MSLADNIRTVELKVDGQWGQPPVMRQRVDISFDDLQDQYVRYTYRIVHCNRDWTPSDIYRGDYMTGMNETDVIDYEPSRNTEQSYFHYQFSLPNAEHKLLISGNYRVEILEWGADEPVAVVCFSVSENKVGITAEVTANTDIDTYEAHQQMEMSLDYRNLGTSNAERELMPVVVQRGRWDNCVTDLRPNYLRAGQMVYSHNADLIFPAGNEYRRFEILDEYVATKGVDRMRYENGLYHAYVYPDEPRDHYLYDEDQDGRYLVRNGDNERNDTESDYFITHFALQMPRLEGGQLYINGDMTDGMFTDDYVMDYDDINHQYDIALSLKQGSYNYQYLFVPDGTNIGLTAPVEGNYHQTENEYYIYVYWRPMGGRYDRLVGFKTLRYKK